MRFLRRLWTWLFGPPVEFQWVESGGEVSLDEVDLIDALHPWRSD